MSQERREDIRVTHEPRTYAVNGPHSFFRDVSAVAIGDQDANRRLARHGREVLYEIDHATVEGRRAESVLRESTRQQDGSQHERRLRQVKMEAQESRTDATTGAASLGAFVTPSYVLQQWAPFRGLHRSFTDQTTLLPLAEYGLAVHLPSFTSTASAGVQPSGENTTVSETDPTGLDLTTTVQVFTGQLTISQQLYDRGFHDATYNGGAFDVVAGQQIKQQLDETVNKYVLQQALQAGTFAAGSAEAGNAWMPTFYGDVGDLRNKLTDTSGVRIRASHLFTTSDLYSYATRQLDGQNRPVLLPSFNPGPPQILDGNDKDKWWGFTGTVMPGVVFWFIDDAIPAAGNNTQIIVCDPSKVVTFEGDPIVFAYPQTLGNQLSVVVGMRQYVAAIPRYPGALAYTSSNVYPTTLS